MTQLISLYHPSPFPCFSHEKTVEKVEYERLLVGTQRANFLNLYFILILKTKDYYKHILSFNHQFTKSSSNYY